MGDWGFLEKLLDQVQEHSTVSVWGDEQSDFECNTAQPGCTNVCYDQAFPISHIRYWVLQFLFVSTPTLVYLGHVIYLSRREERLRQKEGELRALPAKDPRVERALASIERQMAKISVAEDGHLRIRGALMGTYVASVLCKSVLEAGFLYGQWRLYGWTMEPVFVCQRSPCPYLVDCFVSRPTEKTIFIIFMLVVGLISLVLNLLELAYLLCRCLSRGVRARQRQDAPPAPGTSSEPYADQVFFYLPMSEGPSSPPCPTYNGLSSSEQNWANLTTEERLASSRAPLFLDPPPQTGRKSPSRPSSSASKKQYVLPFRVYCQKEHYYTQNSQKLCLILSYDNILCTSLPVSEFVQRPHRGKAFFPAYIVNNSSQEKIFHSYRICDNAERRSSLIVGLTERRHSAHVTYLVSSGARTGILVVLNYPVMPGKPTLSSLAGQCGLESSSDLSGKVVIVKKEEVDSETDPL
ncbi:hypothetical protein E5288_WYG004255 [Bos mutus]|uniref:Gap junction protein n=1 Tax=Bos mutus TaxID=72004 RepID=A0A6B0R7L9_9CETA|nr:hypothetical protein [Bos mutus]